MQDAIKILAQRFTNFFTRSVAPSSLFFVLLYFNDRFFNDGYFFGEFLCFLDQVKSIHDVILYICLVLILLAYGYINQIFSQFLDNFIKENYDDNDKEYNELRKKVIKKVIKKSTIWKDDAIIALNDYNLYQILGKDKSITPSNSYVDEAKSIHTLVVSICLNLCFITMYTVIFIFALIVILTFSKKAQNIITIPSKSRYKARNKRLYINYLLKDDSKNKNEKEIKN